MRMAIVAGLSAALLWAGAHAAERGGAAGARLLVGLWEGVDPGDGSLTQRAITCDRDGLCEVLGSDSFFRLCDGTQGILEGTGTVRDGVLTVPGFTLTCANGVSVRVDTTFTPDRRNGTLVEQTANPDIAAITFHELSRAARRARLAPGPAAVVGAALQGAPRR